MTEKKDPKDEDVTEEIDDAEDTEEGKPTGSNQNKKQTFTFEEHTAEVKRIVAKEKASWKRSLDKNQGEWTETETALRNDIEARDKVIKEQVDFLMEDLEIDEITKELLAKEDVLEQFSTLRKIAEKKGKVEMPKPPKGSKKKEDKEFKSTFNAGL